MSMDAHLPPPEELQREVDTVLSELLALHKQQNGGESENPIPSDDDAVQYWTRLVNKFRFYTNGARKGEQRPAATLRKLALAAHGQHLRSLQPKGELDGPEAAEPGPPPRLPPPLPCHAPDPCPRCSLQSAAPAAAWKHAGVSAGC